MAFDDDDDDDDDSPLTTRPAGAQTPGNGEDALEDDEVPDFKLFSSLLSGNKGLSGKTIRRGEKDFEEHGTRAQDNTLESSRQVMEEVLAHTRVHKKESWVRAWYFPERWANEPSDGDDLWLRERVVAVENEKGSWLKDMGRVVPATRDPDRAARLWLLPEEALFLVERGTVDLWWPDRPLEELMPKPDSDLGEPWEPFGPDNYDVGIPLSLEAAYAMLIGTEGERGKVTLPKYQVYSHIKRSGFRILRAPPDPSLPRAPETSSTTLWQWLFSFLPQNRQPKVTNTWGPLVQPDLYRTYQPIYQRLAIMPRHTPVEAPPTTAPEPEDPYRVFYYVWKADGGPFSKRAPPPPDFRIAVTDTDDTGVPELQQLDALLLSSAPYDPPSRRPEWQTPGRMYQRLRHGHRSILVAIVDRGLVNFMRFGEGAFGEERLFERFDGGMRGGKKSGGQGRGGARGRGRGRGRGRR